MVLDAEAGPLGRVWCLYEIWTTVREKGLGALHLLTYGFTNSDIRDCFQVSRRGARGAAKGPPAKGAGCGCGSCNSGSSDMLGSVAAAAAASPSMGHCILGGKK